MISIHALREEGDRDRLRTLGGRGSISIHALREEGDQARDHGVSRRTEGISIHALREEGDHSSRADVVQSD